MSSPVCCAASSAPSPWSRSSVTGRTSPPRSPSRSRPRSPCRASPDTFQIADVKDDGSYLADMGRPEAARVKQEAAIAEADARRTAEQRRLAAEQDILDAQREFELRNAEVTAETEAAKATAAAAGPSPRLRASRRFSRLRSESPRSRQL